MKALRWHGKRDVRVDEVPLGTEDFATHRLSLAEAPEAYATFQRKEDQRQKILFQPHGAAAASGNGAS